MIKYKKIGVVTAFDMVNSIGLLNEYQNIDKFYYSHIKVLQDKQAILIAAVGNEAIVFNNEQELHKFFDINRSIPIQFEGNFFANNITIVELWFEKIEFNQDLFFELINIEKNLNFDLETIKNISQKCNVFVRLFGKEYAQNKLLIPMSIYIGKLLSSYYKYTEWKIEKDFWINPYFYPELYVGSRKLNIFFHTSNQIANGKIDILNCINLLTFKLENRPNFI